jgi:hypothetical protein
VRHKKSIVPAAFSYKKDFTVWVNLPDNPIVQLHNGHRKPNKWRKIKAKIIERFGTIDAAAQYISCHRNSIRHAVDGNCPRVLIRLEEALR